MTESARVQLFRFSDLDGFEVKEAAFFNKTFPKHFHTDWSLGRIDMGCEYIQFQEAEIPLFRNAIILIPPYSVHANWGNKNALWKYQSIYLNEDLVKHIVHKANLDYSQLVAQPYYLAYNLPRIDLKSLDYYSQVENILSLIFEKKITEENEQLKSEILRYLNANFRNKISLSDLEKTFKINKYKILRDFKNKIGISPQEYITALRMENSKTAFFENKQIVRIALENGFYDQSHFVHAFKRYFGITPFSYKSNCNILQDAE